MLVYPSLGFVFSWVSHLFLENQRNKTWFLDLELRESIVPWPQQHVNLFGSSLYLWIFRFICIFKLLYFSVIARLHYTLLQTQYFMNKQSILNLIVISFEIKSKVSFAPFTSILKIKLQTSSQRLWLGVSFHLLKSKMNVLDISHSS